MGMDPEGGPAPLICVKCKAALAPAEKETTHANQTLHGYQHYVASEHTILRCTQCHKVRAVSAKPL